jgi:MYXO-CTERM domain-containing protein
MVAAALLLLVPSAFGFELTGWMYAPEQLPVNFFMTDYLEDSLPQEIDAETGRYYQEDVAIKMFCNWHWTAYCDEVLPARWVQNHKYEDANCAIIDYEYQGVSPGNEGENPSDSLVKFYWDDPKDAHATGVNAVNISRIDYTNYVKRVGATKIYGVVPGNDIVFNNDINWGTTEEIEAGCTGDVRSVEATGTHEVGHLLGMAHSCEQDDLCTEKDLQEATMFWTGGSCVTDRASIGDDDITGITALYGPFVRFNIVSEDDDSTAVSGKAPLEVCFELEADEDTVAEIQSIEWAFGDGETSTELEPCHTFETQGQFTINATFNGVSDACGEWGHTQRELGIVLVCGEPEPGFELQAVSGLTYQTLNQTVVDTYGCVDGLTWEVFKGGSASGEPLFEYNSWSPQLVFEEEGDYTVRLTAYGPGGESSIENVIAIEKTRSCSTTSGGGAGLGAGLMALVGLLFRRRR